MIFVTLTVLSVITNLNSERDKECIKVRVNIFFILFVHQKLLQIVNAYYFTLNVKKKNIFKLKTKKVSFHLKSI